MTKRQETRLKQPFKYTNLMKMIFRTTIIVCLLVVSTASFGQNSNEELLPKTLPPSPEVAALGEFGSYEVNHFTGLANIQIPLHEIVAHDITVPIVLRYHPAGIKVTDRPTWVGLGWSLDVGGHISRQTMGLPDEDPAGYLNESFPMPGTLDVFDNVDLNLINNINRGLKDVEPDIFSYSFGGYAGKFLLGKSLSTTNNVDVSQPSWYYNSARTTEAQNACDDNEFIKIPYNPIKFVKDLSNGLAFEAYDPSGRLYSFIGAEEVTTNLDNGRSSRTAWKLKEITSRNRITDVTFDYDDVYGQVSKDVTDIITVNDEVANIGAFQPYSPSPGTASTDNQNVYATEQYLERINFPLGKVEFTLTSDDRAGGFAGQKKLDYITVYKLEAGSYQPIKRISFNYGVFSSTDGSGDQRSKLTSLDISGGDFITEQTYSFDYNETVNLPGYDIFYSRRRDLWGYFNNVNNNTLVPRQTISYQDYITNTPANITVGSNFANGRDPSPTHTKANVLEKITYPTGGYTEFTYESNEYLENGVTAKYGGGLRIAQIESFTTSGANPVVKTIKYGTNEDGYGRANFLNNNYTFVSQNTHRSPNMGSPDPNDFATMRVRTFVSNPSISIEPYDGASIVYPEVTVYQGNGTTNAGKTVYK